MTRDFWRPHCDAKTHPTSKQLPVSLEPQLPKCLGFAIPGWACKGAESHLGSCGPQRSWVYSRLRGQGGGDGGAAGERRYKGSDSKDSPCWAAGAPCRCQGSSKETAC